MLRGARRDRARDQQAAVRPPGERTASPLPVPPLPSRAGDAVELFAQRAAAALPGFTVTAANRADVVRLCRRLDGMPLAIELAAVRLRALPLAELADHLDAGFSVLASAAAGRGPRHQTLRTAIEWTTRCARRPSGRCGRGCRCSPGRSTSRRRRRSARTRRWPADEVVHALIGLVDKSVVLRDATRGRAGWQLSGCGGPDPVAVLAVLAVRTGTGCSTRCASSGRSSWPRPASRRGSSTG